MSDQFDPIIVGVDLLLAELARLASRGPHFLIVHRFRRLGTDCNSGEEVAGIWLMHRGRRFTLRLSTAPAILFDYLARYRWLPQSATQIETGMRDDRFCARHAANTTMAGRKRRRVSRIAVKQYVKRIREALRMTLAEAGITLNPSDILVSEPTTTNEVRYRLRATFHWSHHPPA